MSDMLTGIEDKYTQAHKHLNDGFCKTVLCWTCDWCSAKELLAGSLFHARLGIQGIFHIILVNMMQHILQSKLLDNFRIGRYYI